ncbi:unnamed protein product [Bemisia tabaci]|uniref:Peptidase C1A papain C-terminal domain-containing protein n=1 Tax=Bemisia tabaci TaxID=7038 RepID=A0A9P0AE79_BEMTA|nr:unnamed protein product [Bemisia tabaci]
MVKMNDVKWPQSVPKEFDLRKEHGPECADLFSQAQDEGACDTDAPAIVSSILADKYCIQTGGKKKEQFSADFLVRCAEKCRETAWIAMSWIWAWNYGVPTGGDYNSDIGCQPYSYKPCKHTLEKYIAKKKRVMSSTSDVERKDGLEECRHAYSKVKQNKCTVKCTNTNYEYKDMKNRTVRFQDWYFLPENDEEAMKKEIIARGSIAVGFTLYDDFFKYKKGIYRVSKGAEEAAT